MVNTSKIKSTVKKAEKKVAKSVKKAEKKVAKTVEERKFSIGSGSTTNGSGFYPTGRPTTAAFNPIAPQQQQWPMHDVRLQ